jgi:hypothetical protein
MFQSFQSIEVPFLLFCTIWTVVVLFQSGASLGLDEEGLGDAVDVNQEIP